MELWSATRVADALRQGHLTERQKLQYLLLGIGVQFLVPRSGLMYHDQTLFGAAITLALCAISIWGTVRAYGQNAHGDGVRFIERYFVLALPLSVQMYVRFGLPALGLYLLLPRPVPGSIGEWLMNVGAWVLLLTALLWFYWRLGHHVRHAAGPRDAGQAPA